jgi:predicted GNAT family N-acyltransferase
MDAPEQGNLELARRYLEIDRPERALELLTGRQNDLDDADYWGLRASALLELDRNAEAVEATRRGLDLEPDSTALLLLNAHAHKGLGDLAAAERSLLAALRLDAEDAVLLAEYALLVARAGQLDKARALLDEAEVQARAAGAQRMTLHAQTSALGLYRRAGYEAGGDPFDEEGIEHLRMSRSLR